MAEIVDQEELFKTFGGEGSGKSNTAYMLMYRKVNGKEENYKFAKELIPTYLQNEVDEETETMIAD